MPTNFRNLPLTVTSARKNYFHIVRIYSVESLITVAWNNMYTLCNKNQAVEIFHSGGDVEMT
jgi:hypothetical protein